MATLCCFRGGTMVNQLVRIDMGHPWSSGHPNQNPKHGLPQHVVHSQTAGYNCLLKNITKGHWFSWTSTLLARSSHHTVMIMANKHPTFWLCHMEVIHCQRFLLQTKHGSATLISSLAHDDSSGNGAFKISSSLSLALPRSWRRTIHVRLHDICSILTCLTGQKSMSGSFKPTF